jgi:lipopolysaccharide biosynthesis glycosyltransferase
MFFPQTYFNGGVLVLHPSQAIFDRLVRYSRKRLRWTFSEQDLLNKFFAEKWHPLPYKYNRMHTCCGGTYDLKSDIVVHEKLDRVPKDILDASATRMSQCCLTYTTAQMLE